MPVVIKLKGMPWQTTSRDIKEFFRDSGLSEHDIHLAPNEDGKACGVGFACFYDDEDARKAMLRNGAYIGKRYVELFLSSQAEMEKALRDGVRMTTNKAAGSRAGADVDMRDRSARDRSRSPRDRLISKSIRGRDKASASSNHRGSARGWGVKSNFGSRSLLSSPKTSRDLGDKIGGFKAGLPKGRGDGRRNDTRGRRGGPWGSRGGARGSKGAQFSGGRLDDFSSDKDVGRSRRDSSNGRSSFETGRQSEVSNAEHGLFLKLAGMPYTAQDTDILLFLKDVNVSAVYVIPNKEGKYAGKSSGSAFVECATPADCVRALKKHGQFLGQRYINVTRCTLEEIVSTLNLDMSLLSGQFGMDVKTRNLGAASDFGVASFPSSSLSNLPAGGHVGTDPTVTMVAASANINLGDIKDGCVVGIRNLPVSTSPDDILLLFKDFPAIPDSVRIHYIDANRCSGDAMITLVSNDQAKVAIRQLSGKQIAGRKIEMFLL